MKQTLKGAIFVIAATLIFGLMGIFVRSLDMPSQVIVFFSFLTPAVVLFFFFLLNGKPLIVAKRYIWIVAALGAFNILNNFFYFQAYVNTTISNAVLTHYTAPIFVALLAPFILKEKIEKITINALLLSMVGLIFITYSNKFSFYTKDFIGIAYGTASGIMYALVIVIVKYLSKYLSIYAINTYQSFTGALILLPFVLKAGFPNTPNSLFLLILFGLVFGVIATLLYFAGVKRIKSQHVGILAYTEPIAATIYALIFFFEIPSLNTIIGGVLILFSGYLIIRREK